MKAGVRDDLSRSVAIVKIDLIYQKKMGSQNLKSSSAEKEITRSHIFYEVLYISVFCIFKTLNGSAVIFKSSPENV